ncbi:gas vesicle protein GvpN [Alteribacter lacisalsi]|uniref:Gas vesicle protein GvpN n=1 Tax=Alteribacter lacisalsi TaxID=2045244 RepID=A0A2W0H2K8_9BACI|nr:gas vesicle protein GvpN [Alteribacter lacisalsi]PYZ96034.1 gas vesicle protein GvpN [Alteribacter lacisalsi]
MGLKKILTRGSKENDKSKNNSRSASGQKSAPANKNKSQSTQQSGTGSKKSTSSRSGSNTDSNQKSKSASNTGSEDKTQNSKNTNSKSDTQQKSASSSSKKSEAKSESSSSAGSSTKSDSGNKSESGTKSDSSSKSSSDNKSGSGTKSNEKSNTNSTSKSSSSKQDSKSSSESKSNSKSDANRNKDSKNESQNDSSNNRDAEDNSSDRESVRRSRNIDLENFVVTDDVEKLVARSRQYLNAGYPVHFTGPAGVGKTSLALYLASLYDQPVVFLQGNHEMANVDLIGGTSGYKASKNVDNFIRTVYKYTEELNEKRSEGLLAKAAKNGYTVVYDEFTRSRPETNNLLLSVLEEGVLPLYGTKQDEAFIRVHPNFKIIFTSNPVEYAGVFQSQDAIRDRLITLELARGSNETEAQMIKDRTGIEQEEAETIVELVENIRKFCEKEEVQGPSFRASIMIGDIAKHNNIPINSSDEDFITLCKDVLSDAVKRCMEEKSSDTDAKDKIAKELKKI